VTTHAGLVARPLVAFMQFAANLRLKCKQAVEVLVILLLESGNGVQPPSYLRQSRVIQL